MYVPAHFAAPDDALDQLLAAPGAVDLVSTTAGGLTATTLPMLHDPAAGTLAGHLARTNTQWRDTVGDVLGRRRAFTVKAAVGANVPAVRPAHRAAEVVTFTSAAQASRMSDGQRFYNRCPPSRM